MVVVETHTIGIECRSCGEQWRLNIPLTGNKVEVFATMCPCSAIIVGNYNAVLIKEERSGTVVRNEAISKDEKYLSNGHFDVLEATGEQLQNLPELSLEE